MTPPTPPTPPSTDPGLTLAAAGMRRDADERWVEIADRVTAAALTAARVSVVVRAHTSGDVRIAQQVLVAYLRHAVDDEVPEAATTAITLRVAGRETFDGGVIQLSVRYGTPLLPVADRARDVAARVLGDLLGPQPPGPDVQTMHIHICDITQGDPKTTVDV